MAAKIINKINEIVSTITQNKGESDNNKKIDPDAVRFLSDVLNIDFRDGPSGVECWVKQIFEVYR